MLRYPAVAGMFYEARRDALRGQIKSAFLSGPGSIPTHIETAENLIGLIVPHAGYEYSGSTAAHAYALLGKGSSKTFILLGPNHRGTGPAVSVWNRGSWETPLGAAKIAEETADNLISKSSLAKADKSAHITEHSIEVQVPFLQFLFGGAIRIVPVCMADQSQEAAEDIAKAILSLGEDATIIASSDFTHFESGPSVERKDAEAIKAIESLDVKRFYRTLEENDISVCGFGPIAALMLVAKARGGKIKKIAHATSGDKTGGFGSVVGYAAMNAVL